ncbi:Eukaryotic aspartyl protease family protein [Rhynchospora pubera]|uniref:Eukaryotic aspartyl protease family protein n=1 Tax=Rhynchospora pubera TaxID=906938 RepID=A0AAV8HYP3_9POAL|nr:Eukaryotic aspartyl protease family protein [Rhynchospora pubera]KAJ4820382.1 Eukaryotic aspartyl protease family protein [Rhynchospora pubera]
MASLLSLLPLLFLLSSTSTFATDLPIQHVNRRLPSSPLDSALFLARSDPSRLSYLLSQKTTPYHNVPLGSGQQMLNTPSYVVRTSLGSPAQPFLLSLDTSSDAAWVPCSPCNSCPSSTLFLPSNSTSYSSLQCASSWCPMFTGSQCSDPTTATTTPCSYTQSFGDSTFTATLAQETLHLGQDAIPNYAFGCVNSFTGSTANLPKQGLLGLGRGPMSLLSQTGNMYSGVFSYCLPSYKSYYFSGSLRLGPAGQPKSIRYTPLLKNPHRSSLYYVNLTGISVGKVNVKVPLNSFNFDTMTGQGTVVDSGTVITRFTPPVYAALRDEFRRQVNAPNGYSSLGAFDTCFSTNDVAQAPSITLHMDALDLTLPMENSLIHSSATPLACLAMAEAPANVNQVVNVIANLQQQNMRVVIDTANSRVGFARELCN